MTGTQTFLTVISSIIAVSACSMWSRYLERKLAEAAAQAGVETARQEAQLKVETARMEAQLKEETAHMEAQAREETARLVAQARAETARMAAQEEIARQQLLQKAFRALQDRADACPQHSAVSERPLRTIIRTFAEGDTGQEEQEKLMPDTMQAQEAAQCRPRRSLRRGEAVTYADGSYVVNSFIFTEGDIVLELEQEGTTIKGYLTQLDRADRTGFLKSLGRYKTEELPFSMDLQLNVVHTSQTLNYAYILGEGAPRKGKHCKQLSRILCS